MRNNKSKLVAPDNINIWDIGRSYIDTPTVNEFPFTIFLLYIYGMLYKIKISYCTVYLQL